MTKEELQEAKNLLQRIAEEPPIESLPEEAKKNAIGNAISVIDALSSEETPVSKVSKLAESISSELWKIESTLKMIKPETISEEESLSLCRANRDIEEAYSVVADKVEEYLRIAEKAQKYATFAQ